MCETKVPCRSDLELSRRVLGRITSPGVWQWTSFRCAHSIGSESRLNPTPRKHEIAPAERSITDTRLEDSPRDRNHERRPLAA